MLIVKDAVRAVKCLIGGFLYVDERDLYVARLDFAADWPLPDGSWLSRDGVIVEPAPVVAEVEPPPYEPTPDDLAWLESQDAFMPWLFMSPEEIEADRRETLERLRWEDEEADREATLRAIHGQG